MFRNVRRVGLGFLLCWLLAGCAPKAVILAPGPVVMPEGEPRVEGSAAWSLWVQGGRDIRGPTEAGQRVGVFYTRFEKTEQPAFLDQKPETYIAQQLSRYLLHKGLEASSEQTAKALLTVDLQRFALEEVPGSVWDEITVQVAYTVHLSDRGGRDLGRVTLEGKGNVKSPLDTKKQAEKALREALMDTFQAMTRSDAFQRMLREVTG